MKRNGFKPAADDVERLELELEHARATIQSQQTQLRLLDAVAAASDAAANSREALQVAVDRICK